jgi:CPA2 family monovalent cation:H+ antiporter-2
VIPLLRLLTGTATTAVGELPFLGELVLLFLLGGGIVYLCQRLRIAPVVGYLVAGALAGPGAFGLVRETALVEQAAEVGVILLLFTIGLEFRLERLLRVLRQVVLGGGLQAASTALLTLGVLAALGVPLQVALYTGLLVALSSTAVVLRVLSDRGEVDGPSGSAALAVLVFQDLAAVGFILLLPFLAGPVEEGGRLALALGETVLIVAAVLFAARRLVPWLLERIAQTRSQELFLLTVVTLCFGTAWLLQLGGVSLALGAFLAGLMVSESRYGLHAFSQMLPLRTVFSALFFISVGMLLDPAYLLDHPLLVPGVTLAVLVGKALLAGLAVRATGTPVRTAVAAGLSLAQIGEFSFVVERAGAQLGLTPAGLGLPGQQLFLAVSVLLMALTPALVALGPVLGLRLERTRSRTGPLGADPVGEGADEKAGVADHTVVVGFGPGGQRVCRSLRSAGVPVLVVELNPVLVRQAEEEGFPVLVGDAVRSPVLEECHLERARMLVVVIGDRVAALQITQTAHMLAPALTILVRTRFLADVDRLHQAGAGWVVPEELETAVRLFGAVLETYGWSQDRIRERVQILRADDYERLRRVGTGPPAEPFDES